MQNFRFNVKNFRNVDPDTIFDFSPITLLIGPNNSGKSSVLKSLLLLSENTEAHLSLPKKINLNHSKMKIHGVNDILCSPNEPLVYSFYFDSPLNILNKNSSDFFEIKISYTPRSISFTNEFEKHNYLYIERICVFFNSLEIISYEYLDQSIMVNSKFDFKNLLAFFSQELIKIIEWDNNISKDDNYSLEELLNYMTKKDEWELYDDAYTGDFNLIPHLESLLEKHKQEIDEIVDWGLISQSNYSNIKDFFNQPINTNLIDLIQIPFYDPHGKAKLFNEIEGYNEYFTEKLTDFQNYMNEKLFIKDTVIKTSFPDTFNMLDAKKLNQFKKSSKARQYKLYEFHDNGISPNFLFVIAEIESIINEIGFDYLRFFLNNDINNFGVGNDTNVISPGLNYFSQNIYVSLLKTWKNLKELNIIPPIKYTNSTFFSLSNPTSTLGENLKAYGRIVSYSKYSSHLSDDFNTLINEDFLSKWLQKFGIGKRLMLNPEVSPFENDIFTAYIEITNGKLINISNMGTGVSQILALMLLPYYALEKFNQSQSQFSFEIPRNKYIFYLEEPETNLHPNWQSLLLDLIADMQKKFGLQFIIETHSEYMVRKLQYITASKESEIGPSDSIIYYMNNQDNEKIKTIRIDDLGNLSDNFGSGFYDEAINLKFDLIKLNKTQLN